MIVFLAGLLALLPTYLIRFKILSTPTTLLEMLIVVFLIVTLLRFRKTDFGKIKNLGQINYAVILFILAGIISTIVSPDKIHALGQLKAFIIEPVLMFYAIVLAIKQKEQLNVVVKILFWAAALISIFGIVQHFTYIFLPLRFWGTGMEVERITSIFDYPNALSLYLAPLFGFFFVLWHKGYPINKNKYMTFLGLLVMTGALLLTFSRGAWFAVLFVLLLVLVRSYGFKKILIPAAIIGLLFLAIPQVRQRLAMGLTDPSSAAHLDLMQIGLDKLISNPIFGNGLSGFRTTLSQANYNGEILNYPHNIFLNLWLELGLLGLLAFAWIINLAFERYKKNPGPITLAGGVFLLILLLHGLVDVPYFKNDLALLFWFMIAVIYV